MTKNSFVVEVTFKVYDVIKCLNKNLTTHFVWYLGKEKIMTMKLCPLIEYSIKNIFMGKSCRKFEPKYAPFLILVNNPKQPLHARNSFKNEIFWNRITKKPLKSQLYFFFKIQSPSMDNVIKNKRGLELAISCSSGCETSSEKFFY